MTSINYIKEAGFTAVELLITLFIASVFLFAGYQLYNQVTIDGKLAENVAKLSNITYEKAQTKGSEVAVSNPKGCGASDQADTVTTEQISGIGTVRFTTNITCAVGTDEQASLFMVKVTAVYDDAGAQRSVQNAVYAN